MPAAQPSPRSRGRRTLIAAGVTWFLASVVARAVLGRAVGLPPEDSSCGHVRAYLPLTCFIGLVVARRR